MDGGKNKVTGVKTSDQLHERPIPNGTGGRQQCPQHGEKELCGVRDKPVTEKLMAVSLAEKKGQRIDNGK
jgi:hypothetical protein